MEYIKGTKKQCQAYNDEVTKGQGYQGSTSGWSMIHEINGNFYIKVNPNYPTKLTKVKELPVVKLSGIV